MRRHVILFVAILLICFSEVAQGKQALAAPASSLRGNQISASPPIDCGDGREAPSEERAAADRDQRPPLGQPDSVGESEKADAATAAVDLEQDLQILEKKQSELAQCILATDLPEPAQDLQGACLGDMLLKFEMRHAGEPERDVPIGRLSGSPAFFYESGMTIDADGAPNAYHPDNSGLDDLANAGLPGSWEGLAKDVYGEPYIQGPDDPFPGNYVSNTALADRSKAVNDPARYVDASRIPYVVLPGGTARQLGARPGDFAAVFNLRNGKSSYAIFGDTGPSDRIGEGSVALAENLGIRSDARKGGASRGILYLVFPGSGNRQPRTVEEINSEGRKLLQVWEDAISLDACMAEQSARALEGNQATD